jgi:hypothetical protein
MVILKIQVGTNAANGNPIYKTGTFNGSGTLTSPVEFPNTPSYSGPSPVLNAGVGPNGTQVNATWSGSWESPDPLTYSFVWYACQGRPNGNPNPPPLSYLGTSKCLNSTPQRAASAGVSRTYTPTGTEQNQPWFLVEAQATDREGDTGETPSQFVANPNYP